MKPRSVPLGAALAALALASLAGGCATILGIEDWSDPSPAGAGAGGASSSSSGAAGGAGGSTQRWPVSFGGPGDDALLGMDVDPLGNTYLLGRFEGSVDIAGEHFTAPNGHGVVAAKLDPQGNWLWAKKVLDATQPMAGAVAAASDGVVLTGYFLGTADFGMGPLTAANYSDIFLAKLDAEGDAVWQRQFGDPNSQLATAVAIGPSGQIHIAGFFSVNLDLDCGAPLLTAGAQDFDAFVGTFDATGNCSAQLQLAGAGAQIISGLAVDSLGAIVVVGSYGGEPVFNGTPVLPPQVTTPHLFAMKFGPTDLVFSSDIGEAGEDGHIAVDVDRATGAVFLAGGIRGTFLLGPQVSAGERDAFAAALDPLGALRWSQFFGGAGDDVAASIAVTPAGDIALAGAFSGTAAFDSIVVTSAGMHDAFLARLDPDGGVVSVPFVGNAQDQGLAVVRGRPAGGTVAGGLYQGPLDLAEDQLTNAGGYDVFLTIAPP